MKTLLVYAKNYCGAVSMNLALRSTGIIQIGNNIFFEKKLRTKQKPLLQQ